MPINNINVGIGDIPQIARPSCRGVSKTGDIPMHLGVSPYLNTSDDDKSLLKACQDFEEIFVHMLLKEMRSTIPEDGLTEKSTAREIFEDMYDQELSSSISKNNGIGIAKMLYNQMKSK